MNQSNLPPGIVVGDIPGNRTEDLMWDRFFEIITKDAEENGLTPEDAVLIWNVGLGAFRLFKVRQEEDAKYE